MGAEICKELTITEEGSHVTSEHIYLGKENGSPKNPIHDNHQS